MLPKICIARHSAPKGRCSTARIAKARHAIAQHFYKEINCSTQKRNCSNWLNWLFEQGIFCEQTDDCLKKTFVSLCPFYLFLFTKYLMILGFVNFRCCINMFEVSDRVVALRKKVIDINILEQSILF